MSKVFQRIHSLIFVHSRNMLINHSLPETISTAWRAEDFGMPLICYSIKVKVLMIEILMMLHLLQGKSYKSLSKLLLYKHSTNAKSFHFKLCLAVFHSRSRQTFSCYTISKALTAEDLVLPLFPHAIRNCVFTPLCPGFYHLGFHAGRVKELCTIRSWCKHSNLPLCTALQQTEDLSQS